MESAATSVIVQGLLGSLAAGAATGLGALPIFLRRSWKAEGQGILLAIAAGVMLGATVFSLILPAMEISQRDAGEVAAALRVGAGIGLGALVIWAINGAVPHEHFVKGPDGRVTFNLGKQWLFIVAITLHNFPEGLSVGVSYGDSTQTGLAMTIGIGLQNVPEGLAVAAALLGDGFSRGRAFWIALLTGLVEPIGGLVGALALSLSDAVLPWALSFAGGAMLFVISGEVIPETHKQGEEGPATLSLVAGFIVMMVLDVSLG